MRVHFLSLKEMREASVADILEKSIPEKSNKCKSPWIRPQVNIGNSKLIRVEGQKN